MLPPKEILVAGIYNSVGLQIQHLFSGFINGCDRTVGVKRHNTGGDISQNNFYVLASGFDFNISLTQHASRKLQLFSVVPQVLCHHIEGCYQTADFIIPNSAD